MTQAQDDPRSDKVRQFTVQADDDGIRLDRWFKRHLPQVGFATVSRWARTGQVRVDGARADPADRLATGQVLRVPPGGLARPSSAVSQLKELTEEQRAEAQAMLIARTDSALVLNKPPGLATQGGTGMRTHVDALLDAYAEGNEPRPRLVHRLDKDTSGVLLVARTPGSAAFFSKRFSGRSAQKIYWALVVGVPDIAEGTIEAPISKQPGTGGEKMHVDEEGGQPATTRYRVLERVGNRAAWVELQPLTGRTHQLRVHLAAIGHPIVGDGKYGGQDAFLTGSISRKMHLHARRLIIDAPKSGDGSGTLDVTAELPEHFAASMEQMGFDLSLGDVERAAPPPVPARDAKKQAAKAHAKQYRKARRGERRGRGTVGLNDGGTGGKPGAGKGRSTALGTKSVGPGRGPGGKPSGGKGRGGR
jgi:23S rRNA pseudouridine955/2504/2580 synthase